MDEASSGVFDGHAGGHYFICGGYIPPVLFPGSQFFSMGAKNSRTAFYLVQELHKQYFGDPKTTDCISFPMDSAQDAGYHVLGEIFVCPKTALDYVLKAGEEVNEDCYRELTLYLMHGLLHLIGYDDIEDQDREKMRAAENRLMEPLIRQKLLLSG